MKNRFSFLVCGVALWCASAAPAAMLPAEKLLPKDTLVLVTAPDWPSFLGLMTNSAIGQLWRSPEMKPFRDKFDDKFATELGGSLQKELGLKLDDLGALVQGQATFAIIANDQAEKAQDHFASVLLVDTKSHSDQLKKMLADVKKKWADASKPMKVEKIHDYEFTRLTSEDNPLDSLKPKPDNTGDPDNPPPPSSDGAAPPPPKKSDVLFGQVDSTFVLSGSSVAIEKVLNRQSGGLTPALEEQPSFQSDLNSRFRGAPMYAWANVKAFTDALAKAHADDGPDMPGAPSLSTILSATGLGDVTSASLTLRNAPEGSSMQFFVSVPEANRRGLVKAFAIQPKDAAPPPFVPADAAKFWRARLDLHKTWDTLEKMLTDINPNAGAMINLLFTSAGKDKDEHYDLKSELLGNLGDDVISYSKAPKGDSIDEIKSAPSIVLIGSPNPDKLADALNVALGVLAQTTGGVKEQDFLGRKIYSFNLPNQKNEPNPLSFAASGSYVAFSSQNDMIEEFLRSDEGKTRPLRETVGLADAEQKVGGSSTGFFEFDNVAAAMKSLFNLAHSDGLTAADLFGAAAQAGPAAGELGKVKDWADFSLLPAYDAVSKYFYFTVQSINFAPQGFSWTIFAPTPPKLR